MLKLFFLIFTRNIRSISVLFSILVLSATGFLVIRQLTENIERLVAEKTQPFFGADIRITSNSYSSWTIIDAISPYLSWITYSYGEKTEFSTTLFDKNNKTWLIKVVAYSGIYPQKWLLTLDSLSQTTATSWYIAATPSVIDQFASWGSVSLDGRKIVFTDKIIQSSDLGFSLGQDNNLIMLPKFILSGSILMSSGSRLSNSLMLSISNEWQRQAIYEKLKSNPDLSEYQIRSYAERSEQNIDAARELTNYIQLILVVAAIFAGIILKSAHSSLFADLSNTLRIVEILGLSRLRQAYIFLLIYTCIIPTSFLLSIGISYGFISFIQSIPSGSEFIFLISPIYFSFYIFLLLVAIAFSPTWINKMNIGIVLLPKKIQVYVSIEGVVSFIWIFLIIWSIFQDIALATLIVFSGLILFMIFTKIFLVLYQYLLKLIKSYRRESFFIFDGIRSLSRPLMPTIPITLSLLGMTIFFVIFGIFSLSFREKLLWDTRDSANVYAINILDSDRTKIDPILSGSIMYSIIRARINTINNKTLSEHLEQDNPSWEFTREFNITTNQLDFPIIKWKKELTRDEVSVDEDFAERIGIKLWDLIGFNLSGKNISLRVANIRKSVREWFLPFFYFSFQEEAFKNAPKTYFVATYTEDIESWKKMILSNSGPHVTFIDIESILKIVRDVSSKILSVIWLFFGVIGIFFVFAIAALFGQMQLLEKLKYRLYPLFGGIYKKIRYSLFVSRIAIFIVSGFIALVAGILISLFIISRSSFLSSSMSSYLLVLLGTLILYLLLIIFLRLNTQ